MGNFNSNSGKSSAGHGPNDRRSETDNQSSIASKVTEMESIASSPKLPTEQLGDDGSAANIDQLQSRDHQEEPQQVG